MGTRSRSRGRSPWPLQRLSMKRTSWTDPGCSRPVGREHKLVFFSFVAVTCAALMVAAPVVVGAQREGFQGRLSPLPVDARTAPTITGGGAVSAELNGMELTIRGSFEGMSSAATRAHVHRAQPGTPGPVAFAIDVPTVAEGKFEDTVTLDDTELRELRDGFYYLQIHTENNPGGELRGWLGPQE